jgi:hypothetical protein
MTLARDNSRAVRVLLATLFLFVVVALASSQTSPPAAAKTVQSTGAPAAAVPSPETSKYVGVETCKTCHEGIYNAWEKTPHWKTTLNIEGGPSKQGCEGCHGPGADHVAGGGGEVSVLHRVPHSDSWLQFQQCVFQVASTNGAAHKTRPQLATLPTGQIGVRTSLP